MNREPINSSNSRRFALPIKVISFFSAVTLATVYVVYVASGANTTIGNNISTSGTLTVGGTGRFTGALSASSTLQVTGNTRIYGDLTIDGLTSLGSISLSNPSFNGDATVQTDLFVNGGDIQLGTGSASSTLSSANGNLGVGTTTPRATFAVQGNALFSGNITSVANIIATGTLSLTGITGTSTIASGQGFTVGGSAFAVVGVNGAIGLGTTSPRYHLHLTGSGDGDEFIAFGYGNSSDTAGIRFRDESNDLERAMIRFNPEGDTTRSNFEFFVGSSGNNADRRLFVTQQGIGVNATSSAALTASSTGNVTASLTQYGSANILELGQGSSVLHAFKSNGRVGLNTTDPQNVLSVNGFADFTGSVGIGTTSPFKLLSVHGDAFFSGTLSLANLTAT